MRRASALALLLPAFAAAAPVPKATEAERVKRLFGDVIDPDKDCSFTLDGEALRVRVPGEPHLLNPQQSLTNSPRVVRTAEGDFEARVTVRLLSPSNPKPPRGTDSVTYHAGLFVAQDERNFRTIARRLGFSGNTKQANTFWEGWHDGGQRMGGGGGGNVYAANPLTVSLSRVGDKVRYAVSNDGKRWYTGYTEEKVTFPQKVTVGLFAGHDGDDALVVEFEKFTITKPVGK